MSFSEAVVVSPRLVPLRYFRKHLALGYGTAPGWMAFLRRVVIRHSKQMRAVVADADAGTRGRAETLPTR